MSMVRNSFSERREGYTDKAVVVRFVLYSVIDILNNQVIMNNSFLDVYIYKAYEDALQLIGYTFGLFLEHFIFSFLFSYLCIWISYQVSKWFTCRFNLYKYNFLGVYNRKHKGMERERRR